MRQNPVLTQDALEQDLDVPTCGLVAINPRRNHSGVVEHQQVIRPQQCREVGKQQIAQPASTDLQQPAARALAGGCWAISSSGRS